MDPGMFAPGIFLLYLFLIGPMTFNFSESFNKKQFSHYHLNLISSQILPPSPSRSKIKAQVA